MAIKRCRHLLPGPPPPRPVFQVWGGKKNKWITYTDNVQETLFLSWKEGGGIVNVHIEGYNYEISTYSKHLWQNNIDTDMPERTVRIRPAEPEWS